MIGLRGPAPPGCPPWEEAPHVPPCARTSAPRQQAPHPRDGDPRNRSDHGVDTAAELIDTYQLGGIIYFAWSDNLQNPQQIANLSNGVQEAALDQRMQIPMLISTDQEQGIVTRVGLPATQFPGSMALGAGRVSTTQTLADAIGQRGPTADVYWTGASPNQAAIDEAVARAESSDLVVVTTSGAWSANNQQDLVKALVATGTPVVVIAVRDAYDIAYFTEAETYLATYSFTAGALEAATKVLFGEVSPQGKLPVTIPVAGDPDTALYPYGHGLSY